MKKKKSLQQETGGKIYKNESIQCFLCFSLDRTFSPDECHRHFSGKHGIFMWQAGFKPGKGVEVPPAAEGPSLQKKTFVFSYVYVIMTFTNIL